MENKIINESPKQITSWPKLILLHLLPGVIITLGYALLVRPVTNSGYPKVVAIGITCIVVLLPIELGYVLYKSKKDYGSFSLKSISFHQRKLKLKEYLIFVPITFTAVTAMFVLTSGAGKFLFYKAFYWLPSWFVLNENLNLYPKSALIVTLFVCFFITGILAPIVEEIYFRGYLLSRMRWLGKYAPLVNALLFAVYHFMSPWMIITRIIALLPLCSVAYLKRNINIGIIAHCMLNIVGDAVGILVLILSLK